MYMEISFKLKSTCRIYCRQRFCKVYTDSCEWPNVVSDVLLSNKKFHRIRHKFAKLSNHKLRTHPSHPFERSSNETLSKKFTAVVLIILIKRSSCPCHAKISRLVIQETSRNVHGASSFRYCVVALVFCFKILTRAGTTINSSSLGKPDNARKIYLHIEAALTL